jgi:hypothetical protein
MIATEPVGKGLVDQLMPKKVTRAIFPIMGIIKCTC